MYEVVRRRYERAATCITSNRALEEWPPLFGDALLTSAAMDRLLHLSHVLAIEGDSYRNPLLAKGTRAPRASLVETAARGQLPDRFGRTRALHAVALLGGLSSRPHGPDRTAT